MGSITVDYNPHKQNIDAISGALITLSLSILILNSHCMGVAIEGIDIRYIVVIEMSQKDTGSYCLNQ